MTAYGRRWREGGGAYVDYPPGSRLARGAAAGAAGCGAGPLVVGLVVGRAGFSPSMHYRSGGG